MIKSIKCLFIIVLSMAILSCSATPTRESTGEFLDGAAVTAKVKAELVDKLGIKALDVNVKTYKDEVLLSGFVDSARIKQQAGLIAGNVSGVSRVQNKLILK